MKLLLDTHVVLWWRENSHRLSSRAREVIGVAELVFVSAASAWEVAIKIQAKKLRLDGSFESWVEESGFNKLAVHFHHTEALRDLPHHHRDPFDRMLVAQAKAEGLVVVTADRGFDPYGVPIVWN